MLIIYVISLLISKKLPALPSQAICIALITFAQLHASGARAHKTIESMKHDLDNKLPGRPMEFFTCNEAHMSTVRPGTHPYQFLPVN